MNGRELRDAINALPDGDWLERDVTVLDDTVRPWAFGPVYDIWRGDEGELIVSFELTTTEDGR